MITHAESVLLIADSPSAVTPATFCLVSSQQTCGSAGRRGHDRGRRQPPVPGACREAGGLPPQPSPKPSPAVLAAMPVFSLAGRP